MRRPRGHALIARGRGWSRRSLKGPCRLQVWLQKYGYLPAPGPRASALRSAATMQSALAAMQQFYGINTTGRVDPDTLA